MPTCDPPQHLCGGICANNTPQTGCFTSSSCAACAAVQNGQTSCTAAGACDFTCTPPYAKSGAVCICPTECCTAADCGGNPCGPNGACQTPCVAATCLAACLLSGHSAGVCSDAYTCTCIA